jgi:hypothetical protein
MSIDDYLEEVSREELLDKIMEQLEKDCRAWRMLHMGAIARKQPYIEFKHKAEALEDFRKYVYSLYAYSELKDELDNGRL